MSNPEYENKVSPTELYNDDIIAQFEAIRNVIHKEILPSTYNELIVTSNQAGTLTSFMAFNEYPQTEIIFPLSPQSGNINWLEKNFLRFRFRFQDSNTGALTTVSSTTTFSGSLNFTTTGFPYSLYSPLIANMTSDTYVEWGVQDGASIFKSVELNYGGTAIWTSAYQQVESFFTFCTLPDQLVQSSNQYWVGDKPWNYVTGASIIGINDFTSSINEELLIDVDISRMSPILSWLSIIPNFINKLTLRVMIDAPFNWLVRRLRNYVKYTDITSRAYFSAYADNIFKSSLTHNTIFSPMPKATTASVSSRTVSGTFGLITTPTDSAIWDMSKTKWCVDICEIHQNNATMTEDTRIRLIALIQQLGGKWIYPCRYWNTAIAPIQTYASGQVTANFQYVLTGCYFRALAFTMQLHWTDMVYNQSPGNYIFAFPDNVTNIELYCDSELLAQYAGARYTITDTQNALMDNDKYTIPSVVISSMADLQHSNFDNWTEKDVIIKATGPPNGMYSGKYTSEKMGTHNILMKMTYNDSSYGYTIHSWCSALQDGVIVFDNFNGSYFATGRKMQQVYEALT